MGTDDNDDELSISGVATVKPHNIRIAVFVMRLTRHYPVVTLQEEPLVLSRAFYGTRINSVEIDNLCGMAFTTFCHQLIWRSFLLCRFDVAVWDKRSIQQPVFRLQRPATQQLKWQ